METFDFYAESRCMQERHVVPLNDLREHVLSPDCWCHPRADEECARVLVLVHNSMDRRELYERGDLLPA